MFTMLNNPNSMELFVLTHLGGKSDTRKQSSPSFNSFAPVCLLSVFWWLFAVFLLAEDAFQGRHCRAAKPPCQPAEVRAKPHCLRSDIIASLLRETPLCLNRDGASRGIGKETMIMIPF